MSSFPSYTPKEIIKILLGRGFVFDRSKGSHQVFIHPETKRRVVVPMHNRDLPRGTLHAILKEAGIDREELQ
jgi:predicted RNA binding protein YcfA (HicA-like mRNA interferase family)